MLIVKDILTQMEVGKNDTGYFASWEDIYCEGGTRNEAINNLLNEIRVFNRTWERIKIALFFDAMASGEFNIIHYKHPISLS
jgi:hypothetical protein